MSSVGASDDWLSEQRERDRTTGRTLGVLGALLFPCWIPFDALLAPSVWVVFAGLRVGVSALFVGYALALGRVRTLDAIHTLTAAQMGIASAVIAALMTLSPDGYLTYGIGLSLVSWACGVALSLVWWRMAALQLVLVIPPFIGTLLGEASLQDVVFVGLYLLTTGAICTGVSAVRLRGFRQMFDASRALAAAQLKMAEERSANHAKSTFLARMSHELRTPLNAILGYSELIGEELQEAGVELVSHDLVRIGRASAHLLSLIDDILDLSRIEAGELLLELQPIEVAPLLEDAVGELRNAANAKHIQLGVQLSPDLGQVRTDPRRLRQVVVNLLTNAVKFTDHGDVLLTAEPEAGGLRIEVRDTGVGIPADALDRVFDPFVQVDGSTTRRHGGSGLGLAIVRDLVGLLGGRVELASTVGVGTTFTVHLFGPSRWTPHGHSQGSL